jgi:hypothetical protein
MLKCVLTKVAAAAAVAVGGVGAAAYYETNGEIFTYAGIDGGHTCPLSALASSVCGEESSCSLTKSAGCCHAAEAAPETTFDPVAATVGGVAFAAAPGCPADAAVTK